MTTWLRRQLWPVERKIKEFLESDLGWVRLLFILSSGILLVVLAILIQFFFDPESGQGWLTDQPALFFIPNSVLRFVGVMLNLRSLRFLLLPGITFTIAVIAGARYIQDIYNLNSYRLSFRYLYASLFGQNYPYLRIENGEMVLGADEMNPLAVIGGPGYVMITPGNAVLFEHLRNPSDVRGQGLHFVSRFESIKEIVDLRDQQGTIKETTAMSKDGLIVSVHDIRYRYRLAGVRRTSGNSGRSIENPYPFSVQAVKNLVYNRVMRQNEINSWSETVKSTFQGDISNYIRNNLLDSVTAPAGKEKDPRLDIQLSLTSASTRARFRNIGAELLWFDIGRFNFQDPAIEEQRISTWAADFVGDADVRRAFGDAQRKTFKELARAEAQAEMVMSLVHSLREAGISDGMKGDAMQKLVVIKTAQVIEAMSKVYESNPDGG